jgi:hypothetical protein
MSILDMSILDMSILDMSILDKLAYQDRRSACMGVMLMELGQRY